MVASLISLFFSEQCDMVSASRRKPSQISGFTLVELLVVITIIGILMGLLIPAVQAAREAARRNQCSTQINNLAKAAIQEEMAKKQYPGWIQSFGRFSGSGDPSNPEATGVTYSTHDKIGTWVVTLLPYLDAQPTFEIWTQDKYPIINSNGYTLNAAPNLVIMQCPSSPTMDSDKGRNSYISNNGMSHAGAPTAIAFAQTMSRANGVFNSKLGLSSGPAVRADDIKDGLGNTVLFSENLQAQPWFQLVAGAESDAVAALLSGDEESLAGNSRFPQGFVWHYRDPNGRSDRSYPVPSTPEAELRINGTIGGADLYGTVMTGGSTGNAPALARPSSAHNGGVNMGFADGGSRFVMQTIDYRVYQAIMTPRGKSSDVPFSEYVLQGDAL